MKVEVRVKDTRASLVKHCEGNIWHFPGALFPWTDMERANAATRTHWVSDTGGNEQPADTGDEPGSPEAGEDEIVQHDPDDLPDVSQPYAVAAGIGTAPTPVRSSGPGLPPLTLKRTVMTHNVARGDDAALAAASLPDRPRIHRPPRRPQPPARGSTGQAHCHSPAGDRLGCGR